MENYLDMQDRLQNWRNEHNLILLSTPAKTGLWNEQQQWDSSIMQRITDARKVT